MPTIDETHGEGLAKTLGSKALFVRTDVSRWEDAQQLSACTLDAFPDASTFYLIMPVEARWRMREHLIPQNGTR